MTPVMWRGGLRIGLSVTADEACAIALRRGRVIWRDRETIEGGGSSDALERLLKRAPAGWRRDVVCAIGPDAAQLRRVRGLPSVRDERILRDLARENAERFFADGKGVLVTGGVRRIAADEAWIGAIARRVFDDVSSACRAVRVRLTGVAPSAALLRAVPGGRQRLWRDGQIHQELVFDERGMLLCSRRFLADVIDDTSSAPADFEEALAAARASASDPMLVRPAGVATPSVPTWRVRTAAIAAALMMAAAFVAPAMQAALASRAMTRELRRLQGQRSTAVAMERELAASRDALNALREYTMQSRSATMFLEELTRRLPESSTMLSLRADSLGATLVVIAERAQEVLAAVDSLPTVEHAELTGDVTAESAQGEARERASIRARWRPSNGPGSGAAEAEGSSIPRTAHAS